MARGDSSSRQAGLRLGAFIAHGASVVCTCMCVCARAFLLSSFPFRSFFFFSKGISVLKIIQIYVSIGKSVRV